MSSKLGAVLEELESVEKEIHDLEKGLQAARERKTKLMEEKARLQQQEQNDENQNQGGETPEQLQARIAELQKQIEEAEKDKRKGRGYGRARSRSRSRSPTGRKLSLTADGRRRGFSLSPRNTSRRSIKPQFSRRQLAKSGGIASTPSLDTDTAPTPDASSPSKENVAPADGTVTTEKKVEEPASPSATVTIRAGSRASSDWERPGWAHAMNKQDTRAVDSDPINNPNLQQADTGGYRRQVFAKDLEIDKGTFIKHQAKPPEPRLTWIVLRIDDKGVPGKVVMHLHGKDVLALVDHFASLQDTSITPGGPNRASLTVQCEPPLYVTKQGPQGLASKSGVYGVIQEGHEIVDKALEAAGEASLSIKQAHIFPVKKSKGGL